MNWFKWVLSFGWHFIGRVRGNTKYRVKGSNKAFNDCRSAYALATSKLKSIGVIELSFKHHLTCFASTIKKKIKGRKKITVTGKHDACSASQKNSRRAVEPWFVVSSLENNKKVMRAYQYGMQIEESFPDLKSHRFGMGLKDTRSRSKGRLDNLLLIAALTHFILCMLGSVAEKDGWHKQFIANTVSLRRVISQVFLAKRLWQKKLIEPLIMALSTIPSLSVVSFCPNF